MIPGTTEPLLASHTPVSAAREGTGLRRAFWSSLGLLVLCFGKPLYELVRFAVQFSGFHLASCSFFLKNRSMSWFVLRSSLPFIHTFCLFLLFAPISSGSTDMLYRLHRRTDLEPPAFWLWPPF